MGYYCGICNEKIIGGIEAQSCSCRERFCWTCWENMFKAPEYEPTTDVVYIKINDKFVQTNKIYYEKIQKDEDVKCNLCQKSYGGIDNYIDY